MSFGASGFAAAAGFFAAGAAVGAVAGGDFVAGAGGGFDAGCANPAVVKGTDRTASRIMRANMARYLRPPARRNKRTRLASPRESANLAG